MNFAKFSRRSLTVRSGYGIEATHRIQGIPLRPHARVGYGRGELHTDPVRVSTGMNAMPGAVADVHENMRARNSRVGTRRQTTQQQPQAQARLARMTVHPLGVMAPLKRNTWLSAADIFKTEVAANFASLKPWLLAGFAAAS